MQRPEVIDLTEPHYIDLTQATSDSSDGGDAPVAKYELVNEPTPSTSTATQTPSTAGDKQDSDLEETQGASHAGTPPSRQHASMSPTTNRHLTSSRASRRPGSARGSAHHTPQQMQTPRGSRMGEWTASRIAEELRKLTRSLDYQHRVMSFRIFQANKHEATQRCPAEGQDLFSGMSMDPVPEEKGVTVKAKFKQHLTNPRKANSSAGKRNMHFRVTALSTDVESVPPYRFHHIEIPKSVLTPQTRLRYAPHVRDLEESEESLYNKWLQELAAMEEQSGFKPEPRDRRVALTFRAEAAARLAAILPSWLTSLSIEGVTKATLIRYMATQEQDDTITPQQKSSILDSQGEQAGSPRAVKAAKMFTEAFDSVFENPDLKQRAVSLRDVLFRDESVDTIVDPKRLTKDAPVPQKPAQEIDVGGYLESHIILGCLTCFSNSCDHGEFDNKNSKQTFSMESCWNGLVGSMERRDLRPTRHQAAPEEQLGYARPCGDQCFRHLGEDAAHLTPKQWTDGELRVLRALVMTAQTGPNFRDPSCNVAGWLEKPCWDVRRKVRELELSPASTPAPMPVTAPAKNLSWYDRHKKALLSDWKDHQAVYQHQHREINDPCCHAGPCTTANGCGCAEAGVLCEQFCRCTSYTCSRKFTGCACHSLGKTCFLKQKERPCVCVQLNRECDPALCGSCGARDRADPENVDDDELHETGCQNCALQRGKSKAVVLGKSQLDGCGYGLWAAEDIAQDEFVIEYVGELITHDEGVRREARRGDVVFNEQANSSYVFTLLESEGIWVDAAVYGNLSRYINHAVESDKKACNITPRVLYINHEYRIGFSAMRDIRAGEELFFNYGEYFPNLTKKLLEDNKKGGQGEDVAAGQKVKRKPGGRRGNRRPGEVGRGVRSSRPGPSRAPKTAQADIIANEWPDDPALTTSIRTKKRKRVEEDEDEEEEYRPEIADSQEISDSAEESSAGPFLKLSGRRTKRTRRFSPDWDDEVGDVELESPSRPPRRDRGRARGRGRGKPGRPRRSQVGRENSEPEITIEQDQSSSEELETPIRPRRRRPPKRRPVVDDDDDDDDDEDKDSPGDQDSSLARSKSRSERKTQRPARYRDDSF